MNRTSSIVVRRRFLRSANIVRDRDDGLDGYLVTPLAQQALGRISMGLGTPSERAFTLTGPYGTGKSSFALFLHGLLEDAAHPAWRKLQDANHGLAGSLRTAVFGRQEAEPGFVVLPVVSRRAPVSVLLAEALEGAPPEARSFLRPSIAALRSCSDSRTAVRLVADAAMAAVANGRKGLFLIFDEFGKVIEEAYYNRKNADLFVLQELAEVASRSHGAPIFLLSILHQSFGAYVDDIQDATTRAEFSKIEGRFASIAFVEPLAAQIRLLASAFDQACSAGGRPPDFVRIVEESTRAGLELHGLAGLSAEDFASFALAVHPLHPLTMVALPLLFRRFGQNERSVFTYLAGNEPLGLQWFLSRQQDPSRLLRLADLCDYLLANHELQLGRHPAGKSLLEANDRILSRPGLSSIENEILKTVAVLETLGMQSHFKASEALIRYAVSEPLPPQALTRMLARSILVHRKFSGSYAIWEGSDVDLTECRTQADRALGASSRGLGMAETLARHLRPQPVVARRHSFQTGALRCFEVEHADSPDSLDARLAQKPSPHAAGRIMVCLSQSDAAAEDFEARALKLTREDKSLLIAVPRSIAELREAIREVQRLKWIADNVKELCDDRVARRELAVQTAEASRRVQQQLALLLDPRPAPHGSACQWFWDGRQQEGVRTSRNVSELLSRACDALYCKTPHVRNELICKREPSSQAAAARNALIRRIVDPECVARPSFGIEGFPPERSMYDCLFAASGMHREEGGRWTLSAPRQDSPARLLPCWNLLEQEIFGATGRPVQVKALCEKLAAPPYGLMEGIHALLLVAFHALHRDQVSLHQEGSYVPDPKEASFELLVRRPDLFAMAGARLAGMRLKVVERMAAGLGLEPQVGPVVRHLYKWYASLPRHARSSGRLDRQSAAFRTALEEAKSPEALLFVDLPKVFGLPTIEEEEGGPDAFGAYFDALNQCIGRIGILLPSLIREQRDVLLKACGHPGTQEGWRALFEQACFLAPRISSTELMPFLQAVVATNGDWSRADSVIGAMASVPMANWGMPEVERFPALAKGKAELLLDAGRSHLKTQAALSKTELKLAKKIGAELRSSLSMHAVSLAVQRAALLACLEALDKEEA